MNMANMQLKTIPAETRILQELEKAQAKAWDALSRYKCWMFGYHASQWVLLNRLLPEPKPNPFRAAVQLARQFAGTPINQGEPE
jgi:hypothetical protein